MPIVYATRREHFNAAHRMHNPEQTDEWNRATFGECNHPNWHGHNYVLDVTVAGDPDTDTGYVIDLGDLKRIVRERVVRHLDHRNLNLDVDFLEGILPSTENLAVAIWRRLEDAIPSGRLHSVRIAESERNVVEYRGE